MAGSSYTQQLILELLVKSTNLQSGLKQVGTDVKAAEKQLDSFKSSMSSALSFAGSVGLAAGVGTVLKKSVSAYGEFVNQVATANQVFGDSFHLIEDGMKDSIETVGLGKTAYVQATTYIAGLGKAAGITGDSLAGFSKDIVGLGADLAAAFNTDVSDAVAAIQSGFSGSSIEPLRKYNIVINDTALKNEFFALTGEKVTDVLSEQQRAAAFISLLYKKSADFQGQWARESDQFNGTMQRLKATIADASVDIGQSFEPAVTSAANAIIGIIGPVMDLNNAMGGFMSTMALGAAAMIALRGPLGTVGTLIKSFVTGLGSTGGPMTKFKGLISSVTPATAGMTVALIAYAISAAKAQKQQQELNDALKEMPETAAGSKAELASLATIMGRLALEGEGWADRLNPFNDSSTQQAEDYLQRVRELAATQPAIVAQMIAIAEAGGAGADALGEMGLTAAVLQGILTDVAAGGGDTTAQMTRVNEILNKLGLGAEGAGKKADDSTDSWDNLADAIGEIPDAAEDAMDALDGLIDWRLSQLGILGKGVLEEMKIPEAIKEWADTINTPLEDGESLWDRQLAQQEAYVGMFDQISAAQQQALADAEAWSGHELVGEEKRAFLIDYLEKLKNDYPILAQQIQAAIDNLQGEEIDVAVKATGIEAVDAKINEIFANTDKRQAAIQLLVKAGTAPADAERIVDQLGAANVIEVVTKAITGLAEDDINALSDEERVTDVAVNAVLDAANTDMEDFTTGSYTTDVVVKADLKKAIDDINAMRLQAARPIYVRVIPLGPTGGGGGGGTGGNVIETSVPGAEGFASPEQQASSAVVPYGRGYAVTAGQPIVHNTRVTVNVPTADPSAIVRSLQKWTRSNGSLPITRGRG